MHPFRRGYVGSIPPGLVQGDNLFAIWALWHGWYCTTICHAFRTNPDGNSSPKMRPSVRSSSSSPSITASRRSALGMDCSLLLTLSRVAAGRSRVGSSVRRAMAANASPAPGSLSKASTQRVTVAGGTTRLIGPEQLSRAQTQQAPEFAFLKVAGPHALDQRIAQFRLGPDRNQFQAGCRAPHFAQQRCVDALRFLVAARQQEAGDALVNIRLLIAVQPARHASPKDPPFHFALHLVAMGKPYRVDAARLLNAEIVARIAEARAQAEAGQV